MIDTKRLFKRLDELCLLPGPLSHSHHPGQLSKEEATILVVKQLMSYDEVDIFAIAKKIVGGLGGSRPGRAKLPRSPVPRGKENQERANLERAKDRGKDKDLERESLERSRDSLESE
jgi:hypothetical protein